MLIINRVRRFITWQLLTLFRTVFISKRGVQIHIFGLILDITKPKPYWLRVAKWDGKTVSNEWMWHKTILRK